MGGTVPQLGSSAESVSAKDDAQWAMDLSAVYSLYSEYYSRDVKCGRAALDV